MSAALAAVLARCAFYGIHTSDEGFYIPVPYRIFFGEALLIDEMQESQFSAFLQMFTRDYKKHTRYLRTIKR